MELKTLGNLKPAPKSNKNRKRIGRGHGSGNGKTAGKGHKGQTARKGGKVAAGFEGGQTPLYRRLPKRGFKNPFRIEYNAINLESLNVFEAGAKVGVKEFEQAGLLRKPSNPVKILARGQLNKALTIQAHKVSGSAREAIQKAGGTLEEI